MEENKEAENKAEDTNNKTEQIPFPRFQEVLNRAKDAEKKLADLEQKSKSESEKREREKLEGEGNYKALTDKIEAERKEEKDKLNGLVKKTFMDTLALKHGLAKPEYASLFTTQLEIDNLEIKNAEQVEKDFVDNFKKNNPSLFTVKEHKVPKTDSKSFTRPDVDNPTLSPYEKIRLGVEQRKKG